MKAKEKLIVALDVDSADRALALFNSLRDAVGMFKIGMQLFTAAGPDLVRRIIANGGRIFLDLKYHDIPNTVRLAGIEATRLGVSIFNIHAGGGVEMMTRTAEAVSETAAREGLSKPKILGVTLLTSMDTAALSQIGINLESESLVRVLAGRAADCGLDGVVASARETSMIRETVSRKDFLIVTPGIRPTLESGDDQRRTMTGAEAVGCCADYIVVGRWILEGENPARAAEGIISEIAAALS